MIAPSNGFNPLRWRCDDSGCYNIKHRPKIEIFADCLPGRIAFTDIDATVEVNGHFLFLEFKSGSPRELPTGQRIFFQRLTKISEKLTVVVICADAETMVSRAVCVIAKGIIYPWQITNLESLKKRIRKWAGRASSFGKAA